MTVLAIAYPLVSHIGTLLDVPAVGLAWLSLVLGAGFLLGARSPVLMLLSLGCLAAAVIGHFEDKADLLQTVPPVVIAFGLAWVFGRTLLPGRTALIARIGERMRGELPEPVARYGQRLTLVWTLFFVLMGLECLLLGLFAPPLVWSLFANFINYGLIALLFVIEYPIRRLVLRDLEHTPFLDSLRGSLRLDLQ
ncbi:MAG: hypothetical protein VBE63_23670 [Lamprobacter sp.]|uniref:COG4648 family protein n=1 Tax=Lamprobacter sp. TaxID=3100796 RepID=UPI002B25D5F4|nr:hypothetical protein [Lamprobacter sp.]MEA3642916.1 hypothetical protein [Lamprobacter sp.]